MPAGMWALFVGSFRKKLTNVLGYDKAAAAEITKNLMADETKELDRLLVKVISQPTKETSK